MKKAGILGGGQLGRMLLQAAANYPVETFVMENDENCPSAHLCHHFTKGDISNFDDVYNAAPNGAVFKTPDGEIVERKASLGEMLAEPFSLLPVFTATMTVFFALHSGDA